jgi:trimethylamine monooxygenase
MLSGLSHFDESCAYFENGESRQIDAVLMCTGYIHNYPFMEEKLRLTCSNLSVLCSEGLYMSVAWEKNPRVFYVGMGSYRLSQIVVDVQGYLVRDIIAGKHVVPDLTQRHPKDLEREREMKEAKSADDLMFSGIRYVKDVMEMTDYPKFDLR